MAKTKKEAASRIKGAIPQAGQVLAGMPVLNAARQRLIKQAGKRLDKKAVQSTLQDLASRKRSTEHVTLALARAASGTIDSVLRDGQQVAEREVRLNKQYRASLIERRREKKPRRARRGKKDEYLIRGEVLHPKTGKPVAGMVVEAIDKDIFKHDFLGVDTTDSQGRFEIVFKEKDFKERGEGLPEVLIRISVDRKKVLHITEEVVKPKPGAPETIAITLPEAKAEAVERIVRARERVDMRRLQKVSQTLALNRFEHVALEEMGKVFKEGLNKAIGFLETRIEDAGKKKTKTAPRTKAKRKTKTKRKID